MTFVSVSTNEFYEYVVLTLNVFGAQLTEEGDAALLLLLLLLSYLRTIIQGTHFHGVWSEYSVRKTRIEKYIRK